MEAAPTLGTYVTRLRERRGLSMADLARAAGVAQSTISRLEADQVEDPSRRVVEKIARVLGVPPTALLEHAGYVLAEPRAVYQVDPLADLRHALDRGPWDGDVADALYTLAQRLGTPASARACQAAYDAAVVRFEAQMVAASGPWEPAQVRQAMTGQLRALFLEELARTSP